MEKFFKSFKIMGKILRKFYQHLKTQKFQNIYKIDKNLGFAQFSNMLV